MRTDEDSFTSFSMHKNIHKCRRDHPKPNHIMPRIFSLGKSDYSYSVPFSSHISGLFSAEYICFPSFLPPLPSSCVTMLTLTQDIIYIVCSPSCWSPATPEIGIPETFTEPLAGTDMSMSLWTEPMHDDLGLMWTSGALCPAI